jgi:hypothetical protein
MLGQVTASNLRTLDRSDSYDLPSQSVAWGGPISIVTLHVHKAFCSTLAEATFRIASYRSQQEAEQSGMTYAMPVSSRLITAICEDSVTSDPWYFLQLCRLCIDTPFTSVRIVGYLAKLRYRMIPSVVTGQDPRNPRNPI